MQQQLAAVSNADAVPEATPAAADVAPAPPMATSAEAFLATPRRKSSEPWECQRCTVSTTTCRRSGPGGKSTLCNGMIYEGDTVGWGGLSVHGRGGMSCWVALHAGLGRRGVFPAVAFL